MPEQSLYRKWRSQTFGDVVGQQHVTQTLLNALAQDRIAHAYLFFGPRGTGKTTMARLLAKAINCETTQGRGEPCNVCSLCRSIAENRCLDVVEIDAASNRGIDDVRALREMVRFSPNEARVKFYIVDEAHQLTAPAFDALLKTLEEPPARVVFVLASTSVQSIPATIVSRCQRFEFRPIRLEAIIARLEQVCAEESIAAETAALDLIARSAGGGLRDALSLLDQLRACEGGVTLEQVRLTLGIGDRAAPRALVRRLIEGDLSGGLRLINDVADEGMDLGRFGLGVLDCLRALLLAKLAGDEIGQPDLTPEEHQELIELARAASADDLVRWVKLFAQPGISARMVPQPQLPLEIAFVEAHLNRGSAEYRESTVTRPEREPTSLAAVGPAGARPVPTRAPSSEPRESLVDRLQERAASIGRPRPPAPPDDASLAPVAATLPSNGAATAPPRNGHSAAHVEPPAHFAEADPADVDLTTPNGLGEPEPPHSTGPTFLDCDKSWLNDHWHEVIEKLDNNKRLQALVRSSAVDGVEGDTVVIAFPYEFHKNKVEEPGARRVVEAAIEKVVGQRVTVRCILKLEDRRERSTPALDDPLVKEAIALMGGRVKGIHRVSAGSSSSEE
ncbi:MAG: DNA polymerase III subunit gamma/tau [Chloroflexi bacterium]|nr:DNA polymerase III subunit gamma/tau [Chloroflexota bacterium]